MKTYIGIKEIAAKPLGRGGYNKYRGWETPKDENPKDKGYFIQYPDGYESWSPEKQFDDAYSEFSNPIDLKLGSTNFTKVTYNGYKEFNNYHHYVIRTEEKVVSDIRFQKGPVKEQGINGCHNEDLINIVIHRLREFQDSKYACKENACAITKLEEAVHWLKARTEKRKERGVEGTSEI